MEAQSKIDESEDDEFIDKQAKNLSKGKVCFICNIIHEFSIWPGTYILLPILIAITSLYIITDKNVALTSLMWAMACLSFGACIGFLFALPKRYEKHEGQHAKTNDDDHTLVPNTNLQEVSDWLTKMLIGIGLIQFKDISQYIYKISEKIGFSVQEPGANNYSYSMYAMALIILFTTCGFMLGYLGTRLRLSPELSIADSKTLGRFKREVRSKFNEIDERVRRHEDIGDMISVAENYLTMANIYKKIGNELNNKALYKEKDALLERARVIFQDIMHSDENNIPAAIGLSLYRCRN